MNVGNQKMLLKEIRAKRNMKKKRDKQRYSPKNENDIERWKWMWLKIFLNKLGGMGVRVRRGWTRGDTGTYVLIKQWKPSPPYGQKLLHHKENRRFCQKPWLFIAIKHYSTKAFYQVAAPKNRDAFRPTCRADFVVDACLPFVAYATITPVKQKYLTIIYSCIYNNQPTNNTFVYFSNKSIYQASLSLLIPTILLCVKHI